MKSPGLQVKGIMKHQHILCPWIFQAGYFLGRVKLPWWQGPTPRPLRFPDEGFKPWLSEVFSFLAPPVFVTMWSGSVDSGWIDIEGIPSRERIHIPPKMAFWRWWFSELPVWWDMDSFPGGIKVFFFEVRVTNDRFFEILKKYLFNLFIDLFSQTQRRGIFHSCSTAANLRLGSWEHP